MTAVGSTVALLSAALSLRMAMECLAYEILQSLESDVASETMETWQPGRLIKELKEIDNSVESDRSISIGLEKVPGEQAEDMSPLGTDVRLSASWINKHWNALGSFLHEPTIGQHKDGKTLNPDSLHEKIMEVSSELDRVLSSTLYATNINVNISVQCECGFTISRRQEVVKKEGSVVCASCASIWTAKESDGHWRFTKAFYNFLCPSCEERNQFRAKKLRDGSEFTCQKCGKTIVAQRDWCLKLKDQTQDDQGNAT